MCDDLSMNSQFVRRTSESIRRWWHLSWRRARKCPVKQCCTIFIMPNSISALTTSHTC